MVLFSELQFDYNLMIGEANWMYLELNWLVELKVHVLLSNVDILPKNKIINWISYTKLINWSRSERIKRKLSYDRISLFLRQKKQNILLHNSLDNEGLDCNIKKNNPKFPPCCLASSIKWWFLNYFYTFNIFSTKS